MASSMPVVVVFFIKITSRLSSNKFSSIDELLYHIFYNFSTPKYEQPRKIPEQHHTQVPFGAFFIVFPFYSTALSDSAIFTLAICRFIKLLTIAAKNTDATNARR